MTYEPQPTAKPPTTARRSEHNSKRLGAAVAVVVLALGLLAALLVSQTGQATSVAVGPDRPDTDVPISVPEPTTAIVEPTSTVVTSPQPDPTATPAATTTPETEQQTGKPSQPTPTTTTTPEAEQPGEQPEGPTAEPPPDEPVPEIDLPGDPGELPEGPPNPPPPPPQEDEPPPPPPPPSGDLDPLPPPEPDPTPEPDPAPPVDIPSFDPGGLSGNAFGCKSQCITKARLYANLQNPHLNLDVVTNIATTKSVWILPAGPYEGANGLPVHIGKVPRRVQSDLSKTWNVDLVSLQWDTSYRIVLQVEDWKGNVETATTLVTTTSPAPDELVSPGSPCTFSCIDGGIVTPSADDFGRATVHVEASAPVTIDVAISTSEPFVVDEDGTLYLASDVGLTDVVAGATTFDAQAIGMAPETMYHVLATAVDDQGAIQQATGTFTTAAAPPLPTPQPLPDVDQQVMMWVERFHVQRTGDILGNTGEIGFVWGIREYGEHDTQDTWSINPTRLKQGESIAAGGSRTVSVHPGGWLPPAIFNAADFDHTCTDTNCHAVPHWCDDDPIHSESGIGCLHTTDSDKPLGLFITAARLEPMRLSDVEAFPTCDTYGLTGYAADAHCVVVQSEWFDDNLQAVVFDALVAIWTDTDS